MQIIYPFRDPGPSSTSTTREVPTPILPPLPSLALQRRARRSLHFSSGGHQIEHLGTISLPTPFLPSLPPIHPKRSMDKCRTCTKYTKQLSLPLREKSAGNVHSSAKAAFPSHPSIHPYDTLISSHTLICILSKKSNPILQFQHLPKLSSQTCTSLLYCSSAFLTISQTPLRLPPNKHRHIS